MQKSNYASYKQHKELGKLKNIVLYPELVVGYPFAFVGFYEKGSTLLEYFRDAREAQQFTQALGFDLKNVEIRYDKQKEGD